MAIPDTHTLTVDLMTITGGDVAGVSVGLAMAEPRLIYLDENTLYPVPLAATTDSDGVATFSIMASSVVGDYRVTIGGFTRTITMPAADSRLSELMEVTP